VLKELAGLPEFLLSISRYLLKDLFGARHPWLARLVCRQRRSRRAVDPVTRRGQIQAL
jgi:hypothetical protein